jgi:hypothetical protein
MGYNPAGLRRSVLERVCKYVAGSVWGCDALTAHRVKIKTLFSKSQNAEDFYAYAGNVYFMGAG